MRALPGLLGSDALVLVVDEVDGSILGLTLLEVEATHHGCFAKGVVVNILESEFTLT